MEGKLRTDGWAMAHCDDELITIFLSNEPAIKRQLAGKVSVREDREDLAQEAWIKFARNSAAALAAPVPYLRRVVTTLAIDHARGRKRQLGLAEVADILAVADDAPGPDAQVESRDQLRLLARVLDELPERQRLMLVAARVEQRRHIDIAREFGVSTRTVELEIANAVNYCCERFRRLNWA